MRNFFLGAVVGAAVMGYYTGGITIDFNFKNKKGNSGT